MTASIPYNIPNWEIENITLKVIPGVTIFVYYVSG